MKVYLPVLMPIPRPMAMLLAAVLSANALPGSLAYGQESRPKGIRIRPLAPLDESLDPAPATPSARGNLLGDFPAQPTGDAPAISLAFSGDNRHLLIGEDNSKVTGGRNSNSVTTTRKELAFGRLWDLRTGKELRRMSAGHHLYVDSASLSADARLGAAIGRSPSVGPFGEARRLVLWDGGTGEEYLNVEKVRGAARGYTHVTLSRDGAWLVATGDGMPASAWGLNGVLNKGATQPNWTFGQSASTPAVASRDGQSMFFVGLNGQQPPRIGLIRLDLRTGKQLAYHPQLLSGGKASFRHLSVSADERLFAESYYTAIIVRDLKTGREVRRLTTPETIESPPVFDRSGTRLLAFQEDGQAIEWNIQTGEVVWQADLGKGPKAISPDGTLLASYRAFEEYAGRIEIVHLESGRRLLAIYPFHADKTHNSALSDVAAVAAGGGAASIEKSMAPYLAGPRAGASDANAQPADQRGRLFLLAVGVSKHKDPTCDLKYAAADATALVEFFKNSKSDLFREVFVAAITNEEATVERIAKAIDWVKNACSENDVCLMMFSGHGLKARKGLYFCCHEGDADGISYTCLNWSKVGEALAAIQAKQTIVLADCCHSGAFGIEHSPPRRH